LTTGAVLKRHVPFELLAAVGVAAELAADWS